MDINGQTNLAASADGKASKAAIAPVPEPARDPPASPPSPAVPNFLLLRLAILISLVLAVQFWLQHHFEVNFWKGMTSGIVTTVAVTLFKFVCEGVFGKDDKRWQQPILTMLVNLVQTPSLIFLAIFLAILGSVLSTVTVFSDGGSGANITLVSGTSAAASSEVATLADGQSVKRFLRLTNPFGRLLTLKVDGYQPLVFDLPAWSGTRIHINQDMERLPTLLVRVPIGLMSVAGSAKVVLFAIDANEAATWISECALANDTATALFGPSAAVPDGFVTRWYWEALAAGRAAGDGSTSAAEQGAAKVLLRWTKKVVVRDVSDVHPGQSLEARLVSADGSVIAFQRFIVSREAIQDILLTAKDP